jgi:hypothetical protein
MLFLQHTSNIKGRQNRKFVIAAALLLGLFVLSACAGAAPTQQTMLQQPLTPTPSATPTLLPDFIATPQAAQAQAQATAAYGQGQMVLMDVTATALAIEREAISLRMAQAAATATAFQQQTEMAVVATRTAEAAQATATRQAANEAGTATQQTAANAATGTAQAFSQAIQATQTQAALDVLQANTQAELQRLEEEQRSYLARVWAVRVFWAVVCLFAIGALLYTVTQFRRPILSRLLVTRWGPRGRGKPYIPTVQADGSVAWTDMSRSPGPVINIPAAGEAQAQGMLPDPQLQARLAGQATLADLLLALNTTGLDFHWPWEKPHKLDESEYQKMRKAALAQALQRAAQLSQPAQPALPAATQLPPEVVNAEFRYLPPEDAHVKDWLGDVEGDLLDET